MNKMLHFFLLISIISILSSSNERKTFKDLITKYLSNLEINDAYLSYDQYISFLKKLKSDFPDYLDLYTIGKTYEGNDMPLIMLRSPLIQNKEEKEDKNIFKDILILKKKYYRK